MAGLGDLFSLIAEEKKNQKIQLEQKQLREEAEKKILDSFSKLLENITKESIDEETIIEEPVEIFLESQPEIIEEFVIEEPKKELAEVSLGLIGGNTSTKTSDPLTPLDQKFVTFDDLQKHYKTYIARIQQQMSTLGGGGEVNLRYLDDVDRASIFDMRFLRYNNSKKKFEFAEVNPHDIVYTTHLVTTPSYEMDSDDYYVGVNYAGPCTITLPTTLLSSGRSIVIKDESGSAETNPITVIGTVDNDAGGFVIQINNGAIQLIYRDGWRII
jgi:hypothetical protein